MTVHPPNLKGSSKRKAAPKAHQDAAVEIWIQGFEVVDEAVQCAGARLAELLQHEEDVLRLAHETQLP